MTSTLRQKNRVLFQTEMRRPVGTVAFEALVVGIINAVVYYTLDKLNSGVSTKWLLVFTGALIHFLFEFSPFGNINEIWCRKTFP
ncbi:hypothetical protein DSLPV1_207 [Dishui lake phycodnavirus 1]|uniref:hypothetical protein n=1 Tax=Dishui lake phycodnavirus 1 TaxID=2079134 RepID=UPI000CD6A39C|nr:hypothetical protein C5Y57_gp191 [Dishui lake phycodnavirus 1]AUT19178.1 hypothetical protein DSLPV1_207 [Dishui lake phycodnavirus 1]